jgi:PKD repeat protein
MDARLPGPKSVARRLGLPAALALVLALTAGAPPASADPVIMAAGDIACGQPGSASPGACSQVYTSNLALLQENSPEGLDALLALGDEQYENGTLAGFNAYFDPSWGRLDDVLKPAPGNHEYNTPNAAGYFDYFAAHGVETGGRNGWYSYDIGTWHLISLNSSNACSPVSCASGSPQETWLRNDLALNKQPCILAYWHHPLTSAAKEADMWQDFYDAGVDFVLTGHIHHYTAPVRRAPNGSADPNGPREVVVGTGGDDAHGSGLLKMTLHADSADWRFVGSGASDSGTATCHNGSAPPPPPPPPPPTPPSTDFEATQDPSTLAVAFEDISTAIPQVTSWKWSFGDGATSTQQAPIHTYAAAGKYTVTLTATNLGGSTPKSEDVVVTAPVPRNPPVVVDPPVTTPTQTTPPQNPPPPPAGGDDGGGSAATATTATTPVTPPGDPAPNAFKTNNQDVVLHLSLGSRLSLGHLRHGLDVLVRSPGGVRVTLTVPASVARRAHLHRRRLSARTLKQPGVATLHVGPKTLKALRRARGSLTAVLAIQGTGIVPYAKTLTLRR